MCYRWALRKVSFPNQIRFAFTDHFSSMTISLGPIGGVLTDIPPNPQKDGFGHNPRCLRRDVNRYAAAMTYANYTYALITQAKDITTFQNNMLGMPDKNDWGVHMSGHYTIGGDPGGVRTLHCSNKFQSFPVDEFTDYLLSGLLLLARRPGLLVPPRHGRQDLVDLADAGSRQEDECAPRKSAQGRLCGPELDGKEGQYLGPYGQHWRK